MSKKLFKIAGKIGFTAIIFAVSVSATPALTVKAQNVTGYNVSTSQNWSGYVSTSGSFTSVTGTWKVPQPTATANGQLSADATWVGIGGVTDENLVQAGTQAILNQNGTGIQYEAWYETLPSNENVIPLTVSPGDSITTTLTQTSSGQWQIALTDNTTGKSYQTLVAYQSSLSSAEWIEEAPLSNFGQMSLDNFGSVSFTNAYATQNGNHLSASGTGAQEITMVNGLNQALSTPSALGGDGASFTVARSSATTTDSSQIIGTSTPHGWHRTGTGVQGFTTGTPGVTSGSGPGYTYVTYTYTTGSSPTTSLSTSSSSSPVETITLPSGPGSNMLRFILRRYNLSNGGNSVGVQFNPQNSLRGNYRIGFGY